MVAIDGRGQKRTGDKGETRREQARWNRETRWESSDAAEHSVDDRPFPGLSRVDIEVEGDVNVGVAEKDAHRLGVAAALNASCGERMPEAVEPERPEPVPRKIFLEPCPVGRRIRRFFFSGQDIFF